MAVSWSAAMPSHVTQHESTAAPPPPATAPGLERSAVLQQLKELGGLRDTGVLSEAEFEAEKAKILQGA